jgi:hypothetical protein
MLVACRLAGLSALEGRYAGVRARAQFGGGARRANGPDMIRIAISQAAFDAIIKTMPVDSMGFENAVDEKGRRYRPLAEPVDHRPVEPDHPGARIRGRFTA